MMKKIAVYVEGQGELIFIRNILFHLMDPSCFSFECIRLHARDEQDVPYPYDNPNAEVHYRIVNVGNDERVLTMIRDNESRLSELGFVKIIGLRDMYSGKYRKLSNGVIDDSVTQKFVAGANGVIANMNNPNLVRFHFSIMEIEAWWLSMYNLFAKIDNALTNRFIDEKLAYDLSKIDPQNYFFHPATEVDRIFRLTGSEYDKKLGDVERITSKIDSVDIDEATENSRCSCFKKFCEELTAY